MIKRISILCISFMTFSASAFAAEGTGTDPDTAFVAMVSQGGMYEVALGKVAETQGSTQDIRDQGNTETHDHSLVGDKLKSIAVGAGMDFPNGLNDDFKSRLAKISALSGEGFDKAYLRDMKMIHDADGAAFAKEAKGGSNPNLKAFATETFRIVQRHLGEIQANP